MSLLVLHLLYEREMERGRMELKWKEAEVGRLMRLRKKSRDWRRSESCLFFTLEHYIPHH